MTSINFNQFYNAIYNKTGYDKFMYLKIFIDSNQDEFINKYIEHINSHNNKIINNIVHADAGFDILTPYPDDSDEYNIYGGIRCFGMGWQNTNPVNKIDFKIKCCAQMIKLDAISDITEMNRSFSVDSSLFSGAYAKKSYKTGFYTYPRSSLSKTKLRLANNTGIIDAGYRGNLIGMFDVVNYDMNNRDNSYEDCDYLITPFTRLLQICSPSLEPIFVELCNSLDELGGDTERGTGGFGSTGI